MLQNRKTLIIYIKLKFKNRSLLNIDDMLKQNITRYIHVIYIRKRYIERYRKCYIY